MDYNFTGKRFIPVEGDENKGFYRDMESNAIVMTDGDEYSKYMQSYNERQRKKTEFTSLQNQVNALKSDVTDIKSLLLQLVKEKTDAS
tara:strand:+ start:1458 stop:1721 length:264 start_codon:yes stop_codon:yes gene_type:complete